MSSKLRIARVLALIALSALTRSYAAEDRPVPSVTVREVAVTGCRNDALSKPDGILSTTPDGSDLVVLVQASISCGIAHAERPRAQIWAGELTILWTWTHPKDAPFAACRCVRHLEFRLSPAPPSDLKLIARPQ